MILVAVRQKEGPDVLPVFAQVGQVRRYQVDAQQLVLGKHHSGIDYQDVVSEPESHHVHPELA